MNKLIIRIVAAFRILFNINSHWAVIRISKDDLDKMLRDKSFEVDYTYHGIQPYIFYRMVKGISEEKSDTDMALDKAEFQAKAYLFNKQK